MAIFITRRKVRFSSVAGFLPKSVLEKLHLTALRKGMHHRCFFICKAKEKLAEKYRVIKKNIDNMLIAKKDRFMNLKFKKFFPVCVGLALLSAAGLAWAGDAARNSGAPVKKADLAAESREVPLTAGGADSIIPGRPVYAGDRGELPGNDSRAARSAAPDTGRGAVTVSRGGINRADLYLMARVIEGEAADEPIEGKVAVGSVIVNRMESGKFPGSVRQVVYQPLAFEAVANGQYTRPLTGESVRAAEMALEGRDPTGGALYYWNPETARSKWVWQRPIVKKIGRHVFAR